MHGKRSDSHVGSVTTGFEPRTFSVVAVTQSSERDGKNS